MFQLQRGQCGYIYELTITNVLEYPLLSVPKSHPRRIGYEFKVNSYLVQF